MSTNYPSWEKRGNTSWVQCPGCDSWFHVGEGLLAMGTVKLACPECERTFVPADAKQIVEG